jgi:DNA-binding winged helix-turn-helix (wHTH) protein
MKLALIMSQRSFPLAPEITTENYQRCSHSEHEADVKDAEMATDRHWTSGPAATLAFGPFRLFPTQRLLTEADKPVQLGSRAFDILLALLERPGDLVSKEELMARVWPNTFVAPVNLAVHISALRRALGDGRRGNRYVVNIPGRGYRFVAPVTVVEDVQLSARSERGREHNLPAHLTRPIGRAEIVNELAHQRPQQRLLTIVEGGMLDVGLTAVKKLIGAHDKGVWLIALMPLEDS